MKQSTAELLKKHLDKGSFEFVPSDSGIEFTYELTDDEVKEIVESEYGTSLTAPVDELFKAVIKKLIKAGVDHAKAGSDKLSDL